jgi:outer membrane protein TolC
MRSMSLPEAISYAKAHQPATRLALARIQSRVADTNIPRAQWYPTIGASAQLFAATANNTTGSYVSPRVFDIPRIGGTRSTGSASWRPFASSLVGIGANQELFDFGRIAAQTAAVDALVDVERERARAVALDVSYNVEEAYFSVAAAKAVLQASQDAYERAVVHRDLAKAGVNAGLRPPIELTRAEADLSRLDIGRVRARGGLLSAQSVFAAAVGVLDAALDVAGAPSSPPDLPDLGVAIRSAEAKNPRLLEAVEQLRAAELATRAISAETRPNLALTATLSGRAGGAPPSGSGTLPAADGLLPSVANWDVGVLLSWPLFDATSAARADSSRVREQAHSEEINLLRAQSAAEIRQAYAEVDVARTTLPELRHAVDAARANYAQADARFKAGLGTSVELADAEELRTRAEIEFALGEFQLARARAEFGRTIAEGL